ncbi:SDR family oxidoreductase [Polyangium aurulentum]|uniref:SDR family oxidoreductase n=1 Tax=Polyangium aurulentum TaxID=2567896 RepID=UPI0010AE1291|nr:SDR family oxidoreductase [Polyangium aurulentum]UQA58528.1 SDR family oxidoreductase [Polyangium aurulentum]
MHDKKVALITGANKGIGFETARQLGQRGMTVLVGARDAERGEAAAKRLREEGLDARFVRLDVTDGATIDAAAKWIERELGRLDVLVNNAGIVVDQQKPSECNLDDVRKVYDANVFGVIAVTQAMLPLLRRSAPHARIVNVSSGLGSFALQTDPRSPYASINILGYNSSKAALNMVTVQFAKELRDTGIKVNAADPGYTATDLNNNSGTQTVAEGTEASVKLATLDDDGPTGGYFDRMGPVPW